MQFFEDLGSLVELRWRQHSYNEEVFPEIAAACISEMTPSEHISPWDVIKWLHKTPQLPEQRDVEARFGNPPITVYDGARFYIDVYFWLDGTTSIHQHAFCGAFHVLTGSSILSQYSFEESQRINAHFLTGKIKLNHVELLEQGDTRRIFPGRQYIHSLFHLDRPSVSLIVRTNQSPSGLPQYEYYKPYFARDPFLREQTMIKRVQSVSLLLGMRHPEADEMIGELLAASDFQTAFAVLDLAFSMLPHDHLEQAFGLSTGKLRFDALFEIARSRHGDLVDLILPVFEEVRRQQNLIQRRGQITSTEHRFFLALLLNVPSRKKIIDLVRHRFPEQDAVNTITTWVDELANTRVAGSVEPNVLGINNYDEDYLFVFQCLLENLSLEKTKAAFEEEFSVDYAQGLGNKPEELFDAIRHSILFKSIFLDSESPGSQ